MTGISSRSLETSSRIPTRSVQPQTSNMRRLQASLAMITVLTEREIIQKLKAAEETLLVIVREEEQQDGEASLHLRRAIDALQEALLKLQLAR